MDPQANLSTLLVRPRTRPVGLLGRRERTDPLEKLRGLDRTIFGVIEKAKSANAFKAEFDECAEFIYRLDEGDERTFFDIVPGDSRLAQTALSDLDDASRKAVRAGFGRFVERCRKMYDCVIIDMNPSVSHITMLSLSAATDIVSPIKPDLYSVQSVDLLNELAAEDDESANGTGRAILINQPKIDPDNVVRDLIGRSTMGDRLLEAELVDSKDFIARASRNLSEDLAWMPAYGNWGPNPSPARQSLRRVVREIAMKIGMRLS